ncbi:MAG TPA: hypothetical protein VJ983_05395 [candidate division Zixibacteria bacterium]|nr:hypothetical protein [candidate division Zixibacteria bacterium]
MFLSDVTQVSRYLPILSTLISALFSFVILSRYRSKPQATYLFWWGIGVAVYGAGTLVEAYTTLFGWHVAVFKAWYIAGALLGGAPLALGSVYLLMGKKFGKISATLLVVTVAVTSCFVIFSPIKYDLVDPAILNADVLGWQSIRLVSPFINSLAGIFLIGGALYSAAKYRSRPAMRNRYIGNIYIAIGALLPGVGGAFSRFGHTEVLYIGEFVGIIMIWYGYRYCQKPVVQVVDEPAMEPSLNENRM